MQKITIEGQRIKVKRYRFKTGSYGFKVKGTIKYRKRWYHVFMTLVDRKSVPYTNDASDKAIVKSDTSGKQAESLEV